MNVELLSELAREKVWSRIHLLPVLQAEVDRDTVRRQLAIDAREKELMKDVDGWKAGSVYNSDRYGPILLLFILVYMEDMGYGIWDMVFGGEELVLIVDRYVRPNYVVTPSSDNMKRTR